MSVSAADLKDVTDELRKIRTSIRRSRMGTILLGLAFGTAVAVGVVAMIDDSNDDRREQENLVFVLNARCEKHNEERKRDAEVLISASTGPEVDPETQAAIDAYRLLLEDTETDCEAEVASLVP